MAQQGGDITDRGHLLRHPKHALAIYERCRQVGVPVVANLPALAIQPGPNEPQDLTAFLFQHLQVTVTTGEQVKR